MLLVVVHLINTRLQRGVRFLNQHLFLGIVLKEHIVRVPQLKQQTFIFLIYGDLRYIIPSYGLVVVVIVW